MSYKGETIIIQSINRFIKQKSEWEASCQKFISKGHFIQPGDKSLVAAAHRGNDRSTHPVCSFSCTVKCPILTCVSACVGEIFSILENHFIWSTPFNSVIERSTFAPDQPSRKDRGNESTSTDGIKRGQRVGTGAVQCLPKSLLPICLQNCNIGKSVGEVYGKVTQEFHVFHST